jgi:hypothetical protein
MSNIDAELGQCTDVASKHEYHARYRQCTDVASQHEYHDTCKFHIVWWLRKSMRSLTKPVLVFAYASNFSISDGVYH